MDNMELEIVLLPYTTYLMRKKSRACADTFSKFNIFRIEKKKRTIRKCCPKNQGLGGEVLVVTSDISKKEDCKML